MAGPINGANYTNNIATPKVQSNAGEAGGNVHVLFDTAVAAVTVLSGDVLTIGKVPKGARILSIIGVGNGGSPSYAKVVATSSLLADGVTMSVVGTSTTLAVGDLVASESLIKLTAGSAPGVGILCSLAILYTVA